MALSIHFRARPAFRFPGRLYWVADFKRSCHLRTCLDLCCLAPWNCIWCIVFPLFSLALRDYVIWLRQTDTANNQNCSSAQSGPTKKMVRSSPLSCKMLKGIFYLMICRWSWLLAVKISAYRSIHSKVQRRGDEHSLFTRDALMPAVPYAVTVKLHNCCFGSYGCSLATIIQTLPHTVF